jgi:hypothetical protein
VILSEVTIFELKSNFQRLIFFSIALPIIYILVRNIFRLFRLLMNPQIDEWGCIATSYLPLSDNSKLQHIHGVSEDISKDVELCK